MSLREFISNLRSDDHVPAATTVVEATSTRPDVICGPEFTQDAIRRGYEILLAQGDERVTSTA
jgi:hypothetical protein